MPCYCGLVADYADCCEPYHLGLQHPLTAEALMRSRFSAFVCQNDSYLLATWDVSKRPKQLDLTSEAIVWQGLEIIRCHKGRAEQNRGTVEFKAYYRQNGQTFVLHEISRFSKKDTQWYYIDGAVQVKPA